MVRRYLADLVHSLRVGVPSHRPKPSAGEIDTDQWDPFVQRLLLDVAAER
jgi:hypothetical protein